MTVIRRYQVNIISFLRIIKALIVSQYALMLEYRAEIALWALSGLLPLIMLSIWSQINTDVTSYLQNIDLTKYFMSAFIVRQFTAVWVIISFEEDNLKGLISPYLIQPVNPFWRYLSSHIAEQLTRVPIVILICMLIYFVSPNMIWLPNIATLLLSLITIFGAFLIRFLLHWNFAMMCFWTDRASGIERLLLIPYLFLSGLVAPLELYPETLYKLANLTPFPIILSFPAKILAGQAVNVLNGFLIITFWVLFLTVTSTILWRLGVRHYSSMGA